MKCMETVQNRELKRYRNQKRVFRASRAGWKIFRFLLLFGLCFILVYPLLYMLSMAFRDIRDVYDPSVIWVPKHFSLATIREVIEVMHYPKALLNSLQVNIVSSLLQTIVCAVTGYGFARFKFRGRNLMFGIVLFSIIVPPQVTITPLYLSFKAVSLLNTPMTFYSMALLGNGLKAGLFIFLFRQFFRGMPQELEDAGAIDGCGFFSCFGRIMLPNATPVMITTVVLSIVWYWNDYFMGSMLINGHETVTMALVNLPAALRVAGGYQISDPYKFITSMQAGSLLTIAPVLLFYVIIQRFFIQGIARSGIVG